MDHQASTSSCKEIIIKLTYLAVFIVEIAYFVINVLGIRPPNQQIRSSVVSLNFFPKLFQLYKFSTRHFLRVPKLYLCVFFVTLVSSFSFVCADDPTPNPLSENITISATVLVNPNQIPNTPPIQSSGPVNLVNTIDIAVFKGLAYPGSSISLLKNGIIMAEIPANPNGTFEIHVRNLNPGTYSFGIRAEDKNGLKSKLLTFTIFVSSSVATIVDGIFIPPTITTDKTEVKKGDPITFSGTAAPDAEVRISIANNNEMIQRVRADKEGSWIYSIDSKELDFGDYFAKARSVLTNDLSPFSDQIIFLVGYKNQMRSKTLMLAGFRKRCDLNDDGRVNLLDFSIMAFWYKRLTFPQKVDLNTDKKVNLTDLSILAYCWTG